MNMVELIYEGKAKRVYRLNDDELIMEFKDEVTALDGLRREVAAGKGRLAAAQTAFFMNYLERNGVRTHFIDWDGDRRITVRALRMVPIEVIVRNYAYGSFLRRMPMVKPLTRFSKPLVEFHLKSDELHDPLLTTDDLIEAGLLGKGDLQEVINTSLKVNDLLMGLLGMHGLTLLDFKLEFGFSRDGRLLLADELSGDTMRILKEGRHLDKELFRKGASAVDLVKAYAELNALLGIVEG